MKKLVKVLSQRTTITIVVLLILAVATIGAVRDSNIIGHAQKAGSDYTIAQEKEQIGLALNEWQLEKVIPGNNPIFKSVIKIALQGQDVRIDGEPNGPLTVKFNKTRNTYTVESNGTITPVTPEAPVEPEPNDPVNPEEPEDPEEVVTVGVKAYQFGTQICLSTPENKLVLFKSDEVLPDRIVQFIDITNDENYDIRFSEEDFDDEEEYQIFTDENKAFGGVALAFKEDRNTTYFGYLSADNSATITKDITLTHSDTILAQYYHDSTDYEYFAPSGGNGIVYINYSNEDLELYIMYNNAYVKAPISDVSIEPNTTDLTINVDDSQVILTSEAEKISIKYNNKELVYYLQDGNLYWGGILTGVESHISNSQYVFERGINYGYTTKFINIGALPTE